MYCSKKERVYLTLVDMRCLLLRQDVRGILFDLRVTTEDLNHTPVAGLADPRIDPGTPIADEEDVIKPPPLDPVRTE